MSLAAGQPRGTTTPAADALWNVGRACGNAAGKLACRVGGRITGFFYRVAARAGSRRFPRGQGASKRKWREEPPFELPSRGASLLADSLSGCSAPG